MPTLVVRPPSQLIVTALAALVVACKETPRPSRSDSVPPLGRVESTQSAVPSGRSAPDDSASRAIGSPQPPPQDSGDRRPVRIDSAFVFRVRAELAALDTAIALSDWRANHPGDSVVLFSHYLRDHSHEDWCARATLRDTAGVTVRHAYFYPPSPPSELQVPPASGEPLAPSCRLGAIWVETPLPRDALGGSSGQDLIGGLRHWYGQEAPLDRELTLVGSAYWKPVAQWRSGGTTVVAALDRRGPVGFEEAPSLLAIAFARPSTLGYSWRGRERADIAGPSWMSTLAERALRLVRAGPRESAPLLQLMNEAVNEVERDSAEWVAWRDQIGRAHV